MANEAVAGFVVRRAGAADPDDAVDTDDASSRAEASRGLAVEEDKAGPWCNGCDGSW